MNIQTLIDIALSEDKVFGDITTKEFVDKGKTAKAVLIANKPGVLCGTEVFEKVYKTINKKCKVSLKLKDGAVLKKGAQILEITGPASAILSGERTALNFIQNLSGISTLTNEFAEIVKDTKTKIYDTRKTLPGYRSLAKYAVICGGGANHRHNLGEMVLIKDNHISLSENLAQKIKDFRKKHKNIPVEIECENINQVKRSVAAKADVIMLDNTDFSNTKKMIGFIRENSKNGYKPEIEVSGGVNLKTVKKFSKLGADRISVGMITHSAPALDITLEITIK
jgi:nicotinate-nucleotide pyrophosphorylase (carboxylating)